VVLQSGFKNTGQHGRSLPTFWRNVLSLSSGLKCKATKHVRRICHGVILVYNETVPLSLMCIEVIFKSAQMSASVCTNSVVYVSSE
jgi:hypothetical protein